MDSTEIPLSSFSLEFTMKSETSIKNSILLAAWVLALVSFVVAEISSSQTYQLFLHIFVG